MSQNELSVCSKGISSVLLTITCGFGQALGLQNSEIFSQSPLARLRFDKHANLPECQGTVGLTQKLQERALQFGQADFILSRMDIVGANRVKIDSRQSEQYSHSVMQ